ncbi:MAG: hypothetical protein EOP38_22135, partial [Rubrivivax sp.]
MNINHGIKAHLMFPTVIGAAGALASVSLGAGWPAWVTAAALLTSGAFASWHMAIGQNRSKQAVQDYVEGRQRFGEAVAPVWTGQIETSRLQMESAVSELSQRFSCIVDKLDTAVRTTNAASSNIDDNETGLLAVFAKSERELNAVMSAMESAMSSKTEMLDKVQSLNQFTNELKQMATDVASIAWQTNLLATSVAICFNSFVNWLRLCTLSSISVLLLMAD